MANRKAISTNNAPGAVGPYSQAISCGGLLFISGQLPIDMATGGFPTTIFDQTRCCLQHLDEIAKEAGTSLQNAVKVTVFLTDMDDFVEMNSAYTEFFTSVPPARACVAVAGLPKNAEIEIEAVCAL